MGLSAVTFAQVISVPAWEEGTQMPTSAVHLCVHHVQGASWVLWLWWFCLVLRTAQSCGPEPLHSDSLSWVSSAPSSFHLPLMSQVFLLKAKFSPELSVSCTNKEYLYSLWRRYSLRHTHGVLEALPIAISLGAEGADFQAIWGACMPDSLLISTSISAGILLCPLHTKSPSQTPWPGRRLSELRDLSGPGTGTSSACSVFGYPGTTGEWKSWSVYRTWGQRSIRK